MPYVLIRHKLKNFAKWKPKYDAHGTARKAGGSKGARLFRNVDKPKETVILFKWASTGRASSSSRGTYERR
jgi:hypothetical protein